MEFLRFNAPDADALAKSMDETRLKLEQACACGDALGAVEHAADLASMLTTARREGEALVLMQKHLGDASSLPATEPIGWFWNAYATALQYAGQTNEAHSSFARALDLCRTHQWPRLESFVLQHWGRSLVAQGEFDQAQACFAEALNIRVELNDPRQASSRRALEALALLRGRF